MAVRRRPSTPQAPPRVPCHVEHHDAAPSWELDLLECVDKMRRNEDRQAKILEDVHMVVHKVLYTVSKGRHRPGTLPPALAKERASERMSIDDHGGETNLLESRLAHMLDGGRKGSTDVLPTVSIGGRRNSGQRQHGDLVGRVPSSAVARPAPRMTWRTAKPAEDTHPQAGPELPPSPGASMATAVKELARTVTSGSFVTGKDRSTPPPELPRAMSTSSKEVLDRRTSGESGNSTFSVDFMDGAHVAKREDESARAGRSVVVCAKDEDGGSNEDFNGGDSGSYGVVLKPMRSTRARNTVQRQIWQVMEHSQSSHRANMLSTMFTLCIIVGIGNCVAQILSPRPEWKWVTVVLQALFTGEICLRFATCPSRTLFVRNLFNVIDCLTLVMFGPIVVRTLMGLPSTGNLIFDVWLPVVLLLKLLRRFKTFLLLVSAFSAALEAMPVVLYTLFLIIMVFAALLFALEPGVGGVEGWTNCVWLAVVTISTVGYGDTHPVTKPGKILTSVLIVIGSLYMAIPIGIVGTAFSKIWEDRERLLVLQQMRDHVVAAGYTRSDIASVFSSLDQDGDCTLTIDEFKALLPMMNIAMSDEAMMKVFDTFDEDGEGSIDFQEFLVGIYPTSNFFTRKSMAKARKLIGFR